MSRRLHTTAPAVALASLLLLTACDGSGDPTAEPEPGPVEETTTDPEPTTEPVETEDPEEPETEDPEEPESPEQPDVGDGSYDAVDDACKVLTAAGERVDVTVEGEPSSADNSTMSERQCRFYADVDGEEVSGTFTLVTASEQSTVTEHHERMMESNTSGSEDYPLTVDSPDNVGDAFYIAYQEEGDASDRHRVNWGVQHGNLAVTVTSNVTGEDAMAGFRDVTPDLAESVLAESSTAGG